MTYRGWIDAIYDKYQRHITVQQMKFLRISRLRDKEEKKSE